MVRIEHYSPYRERDIEKRRKLEDYFDFFIKSNHITICDFGDGYDPITYIETGRRKTKEPFSFPIHYDHARLFKKEDGRRFVIYCPYTPEDEQKDDRIWAKEHGYHLVIYDQWTSLYGCGTSMAILSKEPIFLSLGHNC